VYCDSYGVASGYEDLIALCQALIGDPDREGLQLIARDGSLTGSWFRDDLLGVVDDGSWPRRHLRLWCRPGASTTLKQKV